MRPARSTARQAYQDEDASRSVSHRARRTVQQAMAFDSDSNYKPANQMTDTFVKLLCVFPLAFCTTPQSWSFVQSAGGMALTEAFVEEGEWTLAVRADVSGLERITVKPARINSAMICERTAASVEGDSIFLTIHTGVLRDGYTPACPPARLGRLTLDHYRVFYRGPTGELQPMGELVLNYTTTPESAIIRPAILPPNKENP